MIKTDQTVAIAFDNGANCDIRFKPLQMNIRGVFDLHRVKEPQAGRLLSQWPEPVPSQIVEYDFESQEGAIVEPLWEARFASLREKIEATGKRLPEQRQVFKLDAATFHNWVGGLLSTGDAKLVSGTMPASVPGTPRIRFHSSEPVDPLDRLTTAIENISELLTQALAKLAG